MGFLEIELVISILMSFLEKISMKKARSMGQRSAKSWLRDISDSFRIRIRRENRMRMSRAEEEPEGKRKMMRINEIEKRAKKEEKLVKISGSLNEATKTNEIQSVLHGVSVIMNYFFDFDKLNIKDMKF